MKHINKGIIGLVDGDVLLYRACNKAIKDNLNVKMYLTISIKKLK